MARLEGVVHGRAQLRTRRQVVANILHLLEGRAHLGDALDGARLDGVDQRAEHYAALERLVQRPVELLTRTHRDGERCDADPEGS